MSKKYSACFIILLLLLRLSAPAIACCEGEPPGDCYTCEDGAWVHYGDCQDSNDCTGCESCQSCWCSDDDDNCGDCEDCVSTECVYQCSDSECCDNDTCVTPDTSWETSGSYNLEAPDGILEEINGAINTIPNVSISLDSASVSAEKKQRDCCKADGTLIENGERKAETDVSAEASVDVTVWGDSVEIEFGTETWGGEIEITAEVRAVADISLSVSAGYRWNDCLDEDCAFGSYSGDPTVGLEAEASAQVCIRLWGVDLCADVGITAAVYSDWSIDVTYNESDCDDGLEGSGSLDRLYVKFTATANDDSDTGEYDIYP